MLCGPVIGGHRAVVSNREKEQCDIVTEGESDRLETDFGMHHGDEFVARAVSLGFEGRDHDTQVLLEGLVRAESQLPHL